MKNKNNHKPANIKTDLKHDTMEYAASTEGSDPLDTDSDSYEETELTVEELAMMQDNQDKEAAALINVENDLTIDEDIFPEEDWTDDLSDNSDEEEDEAYQRKN